MRRALPTAGWQQTRAAVPSLAHGRTAQQLPSENLRANRLITPPDNEVGKMHGTLDVRRFGSNGEFYQVRYEDLAGDAFTGSMSHEQVHELLYEKLALNLTDEELERACQRLARDGRVLFP